MPNGTYGGVRGKETKVGQKTFVSRPTRFLYCQYVLLLSALGGGLGRPQEWASPTRRSEENE